MLELGRRHFTGSSRLLRFEWPTLSWMVCSTNVVRVVSLPTRCRENGTIVRIIASRLLSHGCWRRRNVLSPWRAEKSRYRDCPFAWGVLSVFNYAKHLELGLNVKIDIIKRRGKTISKDILRWKCGKRQRMSQRMRVHPNVGSQLFLICFQR